jgi:hypothetical protein
MNQTSPPTPLSRVWAVINKLTVVAFVVPGAIVGAVLAFVTALLLITAQVNAMQTTANGWSITMTCGKAGNSILVRAGCAQAFPMVTPLGQVSGALQTGCRPPVGTINICHAIRAFRRASSCLRSGSPTL